MTTIPTVNVTPSAAAEAYAKMARNNANSTASTPAANTQSSFGSTMQQVMDQAVQTGHKAEDQSMKAISGNGNLTEVVAALSHAEITLQTATAIRDRVVQAYQDIMKMPI